jgi:hypothetical protein
VEQRDEESRKESGSLEVTEGCKRSTLLERVWKWLEETNEGNPRGRSSTLFKVFWAAVGQRCNSTLHHPYETVVGGKIPTRFMDSHASIKQVEEWGRGIPVTSRSDIEY